MDPIYSLAKHNAGDCASAKTHLKLAASLPKGSPKRIVHCLRSLAYSVGICNPAYKEAWAMAGLHGSPRLVAQSELPPGAVNIGHPDKARIVWPCTDENWTFFWGRYSRGLDVFEPSPANHVHFGGPHVLA